MGARHVGARVKRSEDRRILTGQGRFVDDVTLPGMVHAAFRRSPVSHGRLLSIDVSAARALPGVVAVYTGEDIRAGVNPIIAGHVVGIDRMPGLQSPPFWPMAVDKVRFVGDPLALVLAESRYIAEDACELILEEYEPLDPIVTYDDALDPARPAIFEEVGSNISFQGAMEIGDIENAFSRADRVVTTTLSVHRQQPLPMEGRATIASWDAGEERLTVRTSTQSPHMIRMLMAPLLNLPMEKIRVIADDVGGGFGLKNALFREDTALAFASIDLGRAVKWIEDRGEHLVAAGHAREEKATIEAAITEEGLLLGVKMNAVLDQGAYPCDPFHGGIFVNSLSGSFQGPTKLEAIAAKSTSVFTNKATYVSYRGPWASADFMRERLLDIIAREVGRDPVDIRRLNYVVRGQPPLSMLTGAPFSGVTIRETLEQAVSTVDLKGFRVHQSAAREERRYLGVGIASYLEAAPGPRHAGRGGGILGDEVTHLSIEPDGSVVLITQQQPHGQGHQTTLAQVVADELGVAFEDITVRYGDTDITPPALVSTGGSRAATMANGAALHASRALRENLMSIAAELWEASVDDLLLIDGSLSVKGSPSVRMSLSELAARVAGTSDAEKLRVSSKFDGGEGGWSGGTHCCFVEVDIETGLVHIDRYVVIEDCGVPVNPAIVEGQVRGGITQGIGAVLLEHSAYDEDGQFRAGTFMDYLMPTTTVVPRVEIHHVEVVALDPDVNFRGVGEGGMIVAPAAITSAIEDALAPFGVHVREQHLPPARIVELLTENGSTR
jgi:carbon-monoxide dehydrogenase large subunit